MRLTSEGPHRFSERFSNDAPVGKERFRVSCLFGRAFVVVVELTGQVRRRRRPAEPAGQTKKKYVPLYFFIFISPPPQSKQGQKGWGRPTPRTLLRLFGSPRHKKKIIIKMPHAYTEDQLVEQPAIQLFATMGWRTVSAAEETLGDGGTLGRETTAEVVLTRPLRAALAKLNPSLSDDTLTLAVEALARDRSAMSPAAANREVYDLLKDGIPVSVPDREHGGQKTERVRVIDWLNPAGERLPARQPDDRHRRALHLPPGPRRLRQRPAARRRRAEEAGRARRSRRSTTTSPATSTRRTASRSCSGTTPSSSPRTAPRAASARSPPTGSGSSSGSASSARTNRAASRWRSCSAASATPLASSTSSRTSRSSPRKSPASSRSSPRTIRCSASTRPFPAMLEARAAGHGRGGVFWHTQGAARASRWSSSRRRSCARSKATGPSSSSPTAWSWTTRSRRPSRPPAR